MQRAGIVHSAGPDDSGSRSPRVRKPCLTEQTIAPAYAEREAALQSDYAVDTPPANNFVDNRPCTIGELLTFTHGQIQNCGEHETLRNVECIEASLAAKVIGVSITPTWRSCFQP